MEEYKRGLFISICDYRDETIEQVEEHIKNDPNYTINRNADGKIHSRYLGDRYEPAIIRRCIDCVRHYYLFDGDIKDCTHSFYVSYNDGKINDIRYYSSERIQNEEPIYVTSTGSIYNLHRSNEILSEYESKVVSESNNLEEFTLLCDEMIEPFVFKFAD